MKFFFYFLSIFDRALRNSKTASIRPQGIFKKKRKSRYLLLYSTFDTLKIYSR